MSRVRRFATLAAVAAGTACLVSCADNTPPPATNDTALSDISEETRSTPDDTRRAELTRRPLKPDGDRGGWYASILNRSADEGGQHEPKPVERMPATQCRAVEPVPLPDDNITGPHFLHTLTVHWFENASGFGSWRMGPVANRRGVVVSSKDIDRVELVSLLTATKPSVYVLDQMATPPLARRAERRPLDEFERLGLDAVRKGEQLVWTPEAPKRMFGAIRASKNCLDCHSKAKQGDLLGAFTYYLEVPVDQVER